MADLPNREATEQRLARILGRVFREQHQRILDALGDNPTPEQITPELVRAMREELLSAVQSELEAVFVEQAESLTDLVPPSPPTEQDGDGIDEPEDGGIGIDFDLINERAAEFAQSFGFDLVSGITDTTAEALQRHIGQYITDGLTLGELEDNIAFLFGPSRASQIAITEITRAASEGEQAFAGELEQLGLTVNHIWETNDDDRVCPICGPRDGKPRGEVWSDFPPAHVGCRCWTNTVVTRGG